MTTSGRVRGDKLDAVIGALTATQRRVGTDSMFDVEHREQHEAKWKLVNQKLIELDRRRQLGACLECGDTVRYGYQFCGSYCAKDHEEANGTVGEWVVCPRCNGEGTHTNPAIDGNGITGSEMAELGDDFRRDYMAGVYDVRCARCDGRTTVRHLVSAELKEIERAEDARVYRQESGIW